jgi:hypothetical protein
MKNLVTLQSIYEQALELLIKYNPNALEELEETHELEVDFTLRYRPSNTRSSEVTIVYKLAKYTSERLYLIANETEPHRALAEFEAKLKKEYGHGDPVLAMEIEQKE